MCTIIIIGSDLNHVLFFYVLYNNNYNYMAYIIGASLSEPLLDELAGAFLWYIYIYIFVSIMGSPFGPA